MSTQPACVPGGLASWGRVCLAIGLILMVAAPHPLAAATADPDGSQPWTANWIWDGSDGTEQTWMRFRKTVTLTSTYASLPARISCDSKYELWINGTAVVLDGCVKRGPTRHDGFYDTVDLAPYLHQGSNTVAALVWFYKNGGGNSHASSGKGAFILQADAGSSVVLQTDASWKQSIASAYTAYTFNQYSHLPERPFTFDARLDDGDWIQSAYDDSAWANATAKGTPPVAPWGNLWRRQVPQFKDYGLASYVSQSTSGTVTTCRLPYNAHVTPWLQLGAGTQAGKTIILSSDNPNNDMVLKYVTRAGAQTWEPPSLAWYSGETVTYDLPSGVEVVGLKYRQTGYDTTFTTFTTSDSAINTLRTKAARTAYVSIREQFYDCPDRERGQWVGDMAGQLGQELYTFDTSIYPLLRKALMNVAYFNPNDNRIFALTPPGTYGWVLANQELQVLSTQGFWLYYQFTGDSTVLNAMAAYATRVLQRSNLDADGLKTEESNWWNDGTSMPQDNRLYQNGLYYSALQATKKMIEVVGGHGAELVWINARMASIEQNFNRVFWNGSAYRSPGYTSDTDERGAAWAVITGLADATKYSQLRTTLTSRFHAGIMSEQWCEQALYIMGYPDEALARMKTQFAPMINSPISTLWENFPNTFGVPWDTTQGSGNWNRANGTFNHGWAGGSLQMLGRYAAGIFPTTPGAATVQIKPQLGTLTSLATTVATLKGAVSVAYSRSGSSFTAVVTVPPAMTSATLYLPLMGNAPFGTVSVDGATIVQNGTSTSTVPGVSFVGVESVDQGRYVITVAPGTRSFSVTAVANGSGPAAPTNVLATAASYTQINLTWNDASANETGFKVERATDSNFTQNPTLLASLGANATAFSDSGLAPGTTYFYRLRSFNAAGDSANSNIANASTVAIVAPNGITATPVSYGRIELSWNATAGVDGYRIYRGTTPGGEGATPINSTLNTATSYADSQVTGSITYYYIIKSVVSAVGMSSASSEVSATTPAQPINVILNGSFETPVLDASSYQYRLSGAVWTFTGSSGIESNGSPFAAPNAPDGTQAAFLQNLGEISIPVNFAAGTYTLRFQAAQRNGQTQIIAISIDGVQVGNSIPITSNVFAQYTSASFTVAAGYHTLLLQGTNGSGDITAFVDAVSLISDVTTVPAAPTGLAATAGSSRRINLTWNASSGATGYHLYRGTSAGGVAINGATPIATTTYADTGLAGATTYFYTVKAVNAAGPSPASNEASATTFKLGDVNGDGSVDASDIDLVRGQFGRRSSDAGWDERKDINGDQRIDATDLGLVQRNQGP